MIKNIGAFRVITGIALITITCISLVAGNETIFPSALVVFLLFFLSLGKAKTKNIEQGSWETIHGKAARFAINTFSLLIATLSLTVSIFLPGIAEYYKLTGLFDGDFVRVTINDVHEFAYSTCLLLVIYAVSTFVLKSRSKATA